MTSFENKYKDDIFGRLEGFDRVIYRGYLQSFFTTNAYEYQLTKELPDKLKGKLPSAIELKHYKTSATKQLSICAT